MSTWRLSFRYLRRNFHGLELRLLALTIIVCMAAISSFNGFRFIVLNKLEAQARTYLGADLLVTSPKPIENAWQDKARSLSLRQSQSINFFSMVQFKGRFQLANVYAITTPYPLNGQFKIKTPESPLGKSTTTAPNSGQVWISTPIRRKLHANHQDILQLGDIEAAVAGELMEQPGDLANWLNIAPTLYMNQSQLAQSSIIGPGSRVTYRWLLSGDKNQIAVMRTFLDKHLSLQQKLFDSQGANPTILDKIEKTLDYFNLGTVMSIVLASVAINLASSRFCFNQQRTVALMRASGATTQTILGLYVGQMLILGLITSIIGIGLGFLLQPLIAHAFKQWLGDIPLTFSLKGSLLSLSIGLTLLMSIATSFILSLKRVEALHLSQNRPLKFNRESFISFCLSVIILLGLSYLYSESLTITLMIFYVILLFVLGVFLVLQLIFKPLSHMRLSLPLWLRLGVLNISRRLTDTALQVISIGFSLGIMLALLLLKNGLLDNWQAEIPTNSPNYFLINVYNNQIKTLNTFFNQQKINASKIYPMVRGRLIKINDELVTKRFKTIYKSINALNRELNISWMDQLQSNNHIVEGRWAKTAKDYPWVSVEQGVAKKLNLKLGDKLTFKMGVKSTSAIVTSIREVKWTSFSPNFFMLFKPGSLDTFPRTFITSFYLPKAQEASLDKLIKDLPNITVIDITTLMQQVLSMVKDALLSINLLSSFALAIGFIICLLSMLSFLSSKQHEAQILKALGMRKRELLVVESLEALIIGLLSGVIAISLAIVCNAVSIYTVFNIPYHIPWSLTLIVPITCAVVFAGAYLGLLRARY